MMYDELVKGLRAQADYYCCHIGINSPPAMMFVEAADAIEELQENLKKSELDNINLTGWLAEEHAKHQWIPVTERLPKKDQEVFVYLFGDDPYIAWHDGEYWCTEAFRLDEPDDWQPTRWFPLPKPPTQTFGNNPDNCQKSKDGES